jgi:hypothetical protein
MSALQQAKALHKIKKAYKKGLLKKSLYQSKLGSAAAKQDQYIIKIHLTTDKTGKQKIKFTKSLLSNVPAPDTPWVSQKFPHQFIIQRTPNKAPYAKKPIQGKNKEWDTLNKNIDQMLNEIFQTGHQIRLPNPVYPNNRKRDLIFKITQFIWKKRPHSSVLGNYKFVIVKDDDDHLVVNIDVKLEGNFVKGEHQIGAPGVMQPPPKHFGERITRACDTHLRAVREIVKSYQQSKQYEKMVARAEAEKALLSLSKKGGGKSKLTRRRRRQTRKQTRRRRSGRRNTRRKR